MAALKSGPCVPAGPKFVEATSRWVGDVVRTKQGHQRRDVLGKQVHAAPFDGDAEAGSASHGGDRVHENVVLGAFTRKCFRETDDGAFLGPQFST